MVDKRKRQLRVVIAALLVALGIALGRLMAGVPNVELVTLTVFLGGALCGVAGGASIGASVGILHSMFNPLGPAPLPLLAAQVFSFSIVGVVGAAFASKSIVSRSKGALLFAIAGFLLTLFYDATTTLATAIIVLDGRWYSTGLLAVAASSVPFAAVHIFSNTLLFALTALPVLAACRSAEAGEMR